jgi:hypothetical protein
MHAMPHRPSTPLGQHASRALRLVAAAGTGAAGLCAIVGSIALVATITQPASATHAADRARVAGRNPAARNPAGRRTHGRPAGSGPSAALAVFTGHASGSTGQFTIGGNGTWTLWWSYTCSASGRRGSFAVSEDGTDPIGGTSVTEFGLAGIGAARVSRDAGTHYLVVSSACGWTLRILPAPAARPGSPGPATQSKIGSLVRLRLSSKKPSVPATSTTPSQSLPAASPRGIGEMTGPKNDVPSTEMTGVPTS